MPRTPAEGDYSAPQTPLAGLKFGSKLRVEFKLSTVYQKFGSKLRVEFKLSTVYQQCTELSYVKNHQHID